MLKKIQKLIKKQRRYSKIRKLIGSIFFRLQKMYHLTRKIKTKIQEDKGTLKILKIKET